MAVTISGWQKEDTIGHPLVSEFITPEYQEEVGRVLSMCLQGVESANYEFPLFTKDKRRRDLLLNATTRRGADGEITGVIGVGQDITKMKEAMEESSRVASDLT